jgi:hypothetical protein
MYTRSPECTALSASEASHTFFLYASAHDGTLRGAACGVDIMSGSDNPAVISIFPVSFSRQRA